MTENDYPLTVTVARVGRARIVDNHSGVLVAEYTTADGPDWITSLDHQIARAGYLRLDYELNLTGGLVEEWSAPARRR